jgi:hypothetical protein
MRIVEPRQMNPPEHSPIAQQIENCWFMPVAQPFFARGSLAEKK